MGPVPSFSVAAIDGPAVVIGIVEEAAQIFLGLTERRFEVRVRELLVGAIDGLLQIEAQELVIEKRASGGKRIDAEKDFSYVLVGRRAFGEQSEAIGLLVNSNEG